mgnify:CR=1 FL=1
MKRAVSIPYKPKNLAEVSIIRPILIVLLVVYHAFIIYRGGWVQPSGFQENTTYWWIAVTSYSFMLEMFVFISGYVWAFQIFERKKSQSFKQLIGEKFKRLIIPSILFSTIYVCLLGTKETLAVAQLIYALICGYGHMWFLPMLFWCFIGVYVLEKIQIKEECKLILLLLCSIVSFLPLPLRLSSAMYYIFFFYAGFYVRKRLAGKIINISTPKVVFMWVVYAVVFIALTMVREFLMDVDTTNIIAKAVIFSGARLCQILYAGLGIAAMYCTAIVITSNKELKPWIIKIGAYCFGVYLFQQFILMGIYYHTDIPIIVGSNWLPWVGLAIALTGSLLLSWLFRKTKLGRALI